jgi:predicted  nucleic acid-binding Zn-ribbon protein
MPHQCLKCGKVFPSGSQEILKGCSNCGGKKFFYTEQPVSDQEREHLIEQANKDIKVLIREILSQSQRESYDFQDTEGNIVPGVGPGKNKEWIKISPGKGKSKGKVKVKGKDKGNGKDNKIKGEDEVIDIEDEHKLPTVKEILEELKENLPDETAEKKDKKRLRVKKKGKLKTEEIEEKGEKGEKKKAGQDKHKVKPIRKTRGRKPEIITVSEPGVYNIQLEKLMMGFPIIIYRDGSYLVHLPSVFESIERKRKE